MVADSESKGKLSTILPHEPRTMNEVTGQKNVWLCLVDFKFETDILLHRNRSMRRRHRANIRHSPKASGRDVVERGEVIFVSECLGWRGLNLVTIVSPRENGGKR